MTKVKESAVSTLISILRAVHCRSTHHFFAIDALDRLDTPNGRRLASVLLSNYQEYLTGAKDPDTKFKDFQNHVIHVSDNNWGGAPKACETWLARAIDDMHRSDWKAVAYSIGVLSHYFTDPLMPLHTAQHPSEAVVHRPLEWSVCKSYDWIFRRCTNQVTFPLTVGPGWMGRAVLAGAAIAHKHYLPLIEYYDLQKGVIDPSSGLDSRSRAILTEIFDYALTGWARILDRIAALAIVEIPICPLTFSTVMAAVDMPAAWVIGRVTDITEKRAVKAIFDEFQATGQVVKNVPPEIRAVASAKPLPAELRPTPVKRAIEPKAHVASPILPMPAVQPARVVEPTINQPAIDEPIIAHKAEPEFIVTTPQEAPIAKSPIAVAPRVLEATDYQKDNPEDSDSNEYRDHEPSGPTSKPITARAARVNLLSDIVDAPSIGPKTAARFYQIGINTIGQFLAASASEMAAELNVKWMDEDTLSNWQAQTQLVVQVSALCGYKAQLLVAIDCRSVDELAASDADQLHGLIQDFCQTDAGARIIRSAAVPSGDEVLNWIQSAAEPVSIPRVA